MCTKQYSWQQNIYKQSKQSQCDDTEHLRVYKIIIFCTFLSTVEKVSNEWLPRLGHARCSGAGVINESNDLDPAAASRTVVASLHTHTRSQAPATLLHLPLPLLPYQQF